MFKKILMASLAVGALALNAPAALADEPTVDCSYNSVQQEVSTGQNYEGVAWGAVAHTGSVSIRCFVTVNGSEVSSTPTGTGTGAASTAGRVTFAATDTDDVKLCAEYSSEHGSATVCYGSTHTEIPPAIVWDTLIAAAEAIDAALLPVFETLTELEKTYVDPTICPVLAGLAGSYGPITVNSQGDIFVDGEPFWDCPPYDLFP